MPFVEVEFSDLEFHETLGRGSAGSVYRATWISKEKEVAVKKLNLLEAEAEVLSSLSHRNIVQFFGAVTVAPNFCIVTEYAEKGSVYEYLKENTIDFQQILQWARQIALGMNYLHYEAPVTVIHRDLKSKNVVISADLTAKLCDFGSSRFHPHTTKLSLVGTFPWMAPEVIQQQPVTAACDVFSYSVVLWELLTHEVPYKGLEGLQVAWLVVAKEQRLTIPSSCPPVFANLMTKCWAQLPENRYTFREVLAELDSILEKGTVQEETDHFLAQKGEWKVEIDRKLEELKAMESVLTSKEQELRKRERQLVAREKHLESISSRNAESAAAGESHDVERWSEQEVVNWLFSLQGGVLSQHAVLFEQHHICGRNLFQLTQDDLLQMGVHSLGHRKQLTEEIEKLRHQNYRLLHFPPLQHQPTKGTSSGPSPVQAVGENLTIIYCTLHRKGLTPQEDKWKYLVDFEGAGWPGLVQSVQFVFSSSIPSDIVTLSQPPYLTPGWREGPHPRQLECIVYYKDHILRPRETHHQFTPAADKMSSGGHTEELCIKLHLDPRRTAPQSPSHHNTEQGVPGSLPRTPSSPQLTGVWASRSHVIRPPLPTTPPADTFRKDVQQATPPSDSTNRSYRATTPTRTAPPTSNTGGRGSVKARPPPPQGQGAWAKPGSGAAVVRSSQSEGQSAPPRPQVGPMSGQVRGGSNVGGARTLKHSISGPTVDSRHYTGNKPRRVQSANEKGAWQNVKDRPRGGRLSSSASGKEFRNRYVPPIAESELEEGAGFHRSRSTTQAHEQGGGARGRGQQRTPHSEPTPGWK